jgi:hypothetical protein
MKMTMTMTTASLTARTKKTNVFLLLLVATIMMVATTTTGFNVDVLREFYYPDDIAHPRNEQLRLSPLYLAKKRGKGNNNGLSEVASMMTTDKEVEATATAADDTEMVRNFESNLQAFGKDELVVGKKKNKKDTEVLEEVQATSTVAEENLAYVEEVDNVLRTMEKDLEDFGEEITKSDHDSNINDNKWKRMIENEEEEKKSSPLFGSSNEGLGRTEETSRDVGKDATRIKGGRYELSRTTIIIIIIIVVL